VVSLEVEWMEVSHPWVITLLMKMSSRWEEFLSVPVVPEFDHHELLSQIHESLEMVNVKDFAGHLKLHPSAV
jgi:hypothetical protein